MFNRPDTIQKQIAKLDGTHIQSPTLNVVLGLGGLLDMINLSVWADEG